MDHKLGNPVNNDLDFKKILKIENDGNEYDEGIDPLAMWKKKKENIVMLFYLAHKDVIYWKKKNPSNLSRVFLNELALSNVKEEERNYGQCYFIQPARMSKNFQYETEY